MLEPISDIFTAPTYEHFKSYADEHTIDPIEAYRDNGCPPQRSHPLIQ
ncbi:MAG: hypothetical protein NTZ78_09640 [Candidatus Aureabacteria bacterium]|nr:hypothetical protein [Candidatus Auribacterota bacterium]